MFPVPGMKDLLQADKHPTAVTVVLALMFCGFFWLGFFAGRASVPQARNTPSIVAPNAPAGEPLHYRMAGN